MCLMFFLMTASAFASEAEYREITTKPQINRMSYHIVNDCWYDGQTFELDTHHYSKAMLLIKFSNKELWEQTNFFIHIDGKRHYIKTKKIKRSFINTGSCPVLQMKLIKY